MNKNLPLFDNYYKQGKKIILLLCLDLLFLTLSAISAAVQIKHARFITISFLFIGIIFLISTVVFMQRNIKTINNVEHTLFDNYFGVSAYRVHQFHQLINANLFEYHFQPIIDAKTGEIFAYEALMRANTEAIHMRPLEILELARKENCIYEIEKYTFFNVLKIMNYYPDIFSRKKLFINCIPDHQLTEEDFDSLYSEYSSLFQNIVLEINQNTQIDKSSIQMLHKRLLLTSCQLALDDYKGDYSSETNLLLTNPNYIKINPVILRYINIDTKKQQMVKSILNFASQNNIKVIAVGIENYDEFECLINLGVDYIQGFYTARPNTQLMISMPEELLNKIHEINYNRFYNPSARKMYEAKGEQPLSPVSLALERYSDIIINDKMIHLKGNLGMVAEISLIIPNNHNCHIILDHIHLRGNNRPTIIIGKNSSVIIELIGDNQLYMNGIRVQESSTLTIIGNGNLAIHALNNKCIGIGGTAEQDFGNIILASLGNIKIINNGSCSIGIGGGHCEKISYIELQSGNITIETSGYNTVGIGSISGNVKIGIRNCQLNITTEATKAVCIGSIKGFVDIKLNCQISINCDGKQCSAIGVIDDSDGVIIIEGGCINIRYTSHAGAGIGSIGGKVGINILGGDIIVYGEGTDIVGIGDQSGFGSIYINYGIISIILYAANAVPIGNVQRQVVIDGGNIQCDFPEDIIPVNSFQTPLAVHIITETNEFKQSIETISYSYEYKAQYSNRFPYIKVYLPENIILI